MKIRVSEATPVQLDWLVAKCEGVEYRYMESVGGDYNGRWWWEVRKYSSDRTQGGPIVDREGIATQPSGHIHAWWACIGKPDEETLGYEGPTPLIAAMRCYVASKLGDEVEIPEELLT